jgi:hypothetical protein
MMAALIALLTGAFRAWGLMALGLRGFVARLASSPGRVAPQPARAPVMLVESDVRGGVRGVLPGA